MRCFLGCQPDGSILQRPTLTGRGSQVLQIRLLGQTLEHALKDGAFSNLVFVFAT